MWKTIGHDKAINILKRSIEQDRVSHAYLFVGPDQVGKGTLAMDFARAVNCVGPDDERPCGGCEQCDRIDRDLHTDVKVINRETGETPKGRGRVLIGIDQMREIQRNASLTPFEGRYRVFVIDDAEYLSEEAANSLLKTLEEPPGQVILVLLASDLGAMLPTISSRCQKLELRSVSSEIISDVLQAQHGVDEMGATEVARLSEGRPGWAFGAVSNPGLLEGLNERLETIERLVGLGLEERFEYAARLAGVAGRDRDAVRRELKEWLGWWRDVLLVKEGTEEYVTHLSRVEATRRLSQGLAREDVARAMNAVEAAQEHLDRNVNPRLALEAMMLAMPRVAAVEETAVG